MLDLAIFSLMEKEVDQHDIVNSFDGLVNVWEEISVIMIQKNWSVN